MMTVVSITPVKVEADSRTFKQAASIARFGLTSIVVEGERSQQGGRALPFQLLTIEHKGTLLRKLFGKALKGSPATTATETRPHPMAAAAAAAPPRSLPASRSFLAPFKFLRLLRGYFYAYCLLPLRYIPRASLYVLHSPLQFPAVYLLSRRYNVPFIYDAHDLYTRIEESKEHLPLEERWFKAAQAKIESLCIRKAAAMVTVSEGVAELQQQAFGRRPLVIRNCQDPRLDQPPAEALRQRLGLSSDEFLLVTVGQAKPGQALAEAFEALRLLPERVHLACVGGGYERYWEEVRSRNLTQRVHCFPPVKPYEVVPFIRSADAALILYYPRSANYANCLPNGFFQSVMAELPLLYPELPEIKKIAAGYNLGIAINPQSVESIRAAVTVLLTEPEKMFAYKRNLRVAQAELSWEKEEILLQELIAKTVRGIQ